ncbi:MAG: hypothetical protein LBH54_04600 [Clostridiales bacterium]|jgi:hypothetical protein|nr:hypothetical protein [Clostridiales bacterium]
MAKKKILFIAGIAALSCAYSFLLFTVGLRCGEARRERHEQASAASRYVARESGGRIAVFEDGSDTPLKVLEIDVSTLRKQDQLRLREGIAVDSLEALAQLEEDFGS